MSKKYDQDESIQAYVQKKIDAALKAERKRVSMAVKELPLAMNGSKKEALAIRKTLQQAISVQ